MRDSKGRFIKGHSSLHTEQSRLKISVALKGKNTWSKGRKLSDEIKKKIKENNAKYWLGKERPEMKGNQYSIGNKPNKTSFKKGHIPHTMGKIGKAHPVWKEVKRNPLRFAIRQLYHYRQWRSAIFKRDNYSCVLCKRSKEVRGQLEADHFPVSFASLIANINNIDEAMACKELWDINNGRTLCIDCHKNTDNYMWKARMK